VSCGLKGRYVTIMRPGANLQLMLAGVAISVDCNQLPWDPVTEFELVLHETVRVKVPLATRFESYLGTDVCGQLQVELEDMPSFCSHVENGIIECTPESEEHLGEHTFSIN